MQFNERLLSLIEENRTSKNKVLSDLGLNHNSINDWVNKNQTPSGETVLKIAVYFNVSTDYLLGNTNDKSPPNINASAAVIDEAIGVAKRWSALPEERKKMILDYMTLVENQRDK